CAPASTASSAVSTTASTARWIAETSASGSPTIRPGASHDSAPASGQRACAVSMTCAREGATASVYERTRGGLHSLHLIPIPLLAADRRHPRHDGQQQPESKRDEHADIARGEHRIRIDAERRVEEALPGEAAEV